MSSNMSLLANAFPISFSISPLSNSSKLRQIARVSVMNSAVAVAHEVKRSCEFYDMHHELVPYAEAWSWQKDIVKKKKALIEKGEDCSDTLIILQHPPVYTLGTFSSEAYLNFDMKNAPFDVYRTERGGEVTYHGPGQLVLYPIINLRYHTMDLHWYLRAREEVAIRILYSTFAIKASRIEGLTGVWVDRRVGSIKGLLQELVSSNRCGDGNVYHINDNQLIDLTCKSLVQEFCEVFQVDLHHKPISLGTTLGETRAITH